ncbi:MAG: hypothetical protein MZV63_57405 [Marinilabiliales bacterium]|nr:hypothetical protein [Marinilabiliales bacterium]
MTAMTVSAQGGGGFQRMDFAMQGRGMEAADIAGIVFMEANQAKRVNLIA